MQTSDMIRQLCKYENVSQTVDKVPELDEKGSIRVLFMVK